MFPFTMGRCLRTSGIGIACLLPTARVLAAEPTRAVISPWTTLGKLGIALIVVLAIFWVFARVMRQFQGFQGGMHNGLKIVAALSVGQRERVIVVQAGNEQIILGVTSTQINTLHVLNKPLVQASEASAQGDFKSKLSSALKRQVPSE